VHPFLGRKTALAPDLPQVQNTLVGGRAICFPLPFYGFLKNVLADTPASVAVAHTPAEHRAATAILSVSPVYPHFLRKLENAVDFSFIYDEVRNLYCPDNGRPGTPAPDPQG